MEENRYDTGRVDNSKFTFQDLVELVVDKWYYFVLSILLFISAGVLYILSTPPTYQREATIMVKDSRKGSGANELAMFGEIAGITTRRNVDNELFVLRARRLMIEVVERLGITTTYRCREGLRMVDLYGSSPICVTFTDGDNAESCLFKVDLGADKAHIYDMKRPMTKGEQKPDFDITTSYGQAVMTPVGEIKIDKSLYMDDSYIGKTIFIAKSSKDAVANRYRKAMRSVVANKMSSIITLSLRDVSPRRAEDVINTLIEVYNADAVDDKRQIAQATADFIDVRLDILGKELGAADSDIKSFKTRNDMVDIEAEMKKNFELSTRMQTEMLTLESQLEMSRFIKEYLTSPEKEYSLIPATGFGNSATTASLVTQIAEYNDVVLQREKLLSNSSANSPVVVSLDSRRVALKGAILASLDSNIATLDIQLKNLSREQTKMAAKINSVPRKEQEYLTIARQQRIKEELYLYLLNKREENSITLAITENTARVIDPAFGPLRPVAPRKSVVLLFVFLVGSVVPLLWLYVRRALNTTVSSRKDIERFVSAPYLGEIPLLQGDSGSRGVVIRENGRDNISEAFRILRANMSFMNLSGADKVFMVTSSNEHAGKTFVATNLAMVYAFLGSRVLLVDLDLRRRTLSKKMGQRNNPMGVSKYMSDHAVEVNDIIFKSDIHPNVDCIYAGLQPPNPAEQLLSTRLDSMVAQCREQYDYIIIDSVPALVIADAVISSRIADLSIYVVREGLLNRNQLPDIDNLYRQNRLKNMCIVYNGAKERNHRYGYTYTYDDGYDEPLYTTWERILCSIGLRKFVNRRKNR